ncbi:MAG: hypothetical protein PVI44_00575 [Balneolaceae bacterium]|jgi:hypothetical protein
MKFYATAAAIILLLSSTNLAHAQDHEDEKTDPPLSLAHFRLKGYGSINYFNYNWQTDPTRRDAIDVERFVLYPGYVFNAQFQLKGEIEFEHGGTGITKEYDRFEEFGEFETEVESGGEVNVEQLHIVYSPKTSLNFRFGKFKIPFGIVSVEDEPTEYFTTLKSPAMAEIIPTNWYETGLQVFGKIGTEQQFSYSLSLVNGLDATEFSSANWVMRGMQGKFETINAENMALALRLDYELKEDWEIGLSGYLGNSADNRPKPDMDADAYVSIIDGHLNIEEGPITFRAMGLYGHLQNADLVSDANRNLSNNLNVKRTPVGSAALSYYGELAYDTSQLLGIPDRLDVFGRYEFYDSMFQVVKGIISDNPRWERRAITGGLNYKPIDEIVFKAQYTHRWLGLSNNNIENTFSAGIGFEF